MMGELPPEPHTDWATFGRQWLPAFVVIFLGPTAHPALAFDLATETLAAARTEWAEPPNNDDGIIALVALGGRILAVAAERQSVPAIERRRHRQAATVRLSVAHQQAVMRLADAHLDLTPAVRVAVEALDRSAPAPASLRQIRGSGLIEAEPLPDRARETHDA